MHPPIQIQVEIRIVIENYFLKFLWQLNVLLGLFFQHRSFNDNKESFIISKTCKLIEVKGSQQTWLTVKFACSTVLKYCLLVGRFHVSIVISMCVVNVPESQIHLI